MNAFFQQAYVVAVAAAKMVNKFFMMALSFIMSDLFLNTAGLITSYAICGLAHPLTFLWIYWSVRDIIQWWTIRGQLEAAAAMARATILKARQA